MKKLLHAIDGPGKAKVWPVRHCNRDVVVSVLEIEREEQVIQSEYGWDKPEVFECKLLRVEVLVQVA